ncbi:MAG: hypothetical protein AAF471_07275, partial [Myxococcota bacterium]
MTTSRYFSWTFAVGVLTSALVASSGYAMNNAVQDEKEPNTVEGQVDVTHAPPQTYAPASGQPAQSAGNLNAQQLGKGYTMILTGDDELAMWRWKGNRQNVSLAGPLTVSSLTSVAFEPRSNVVAAGNSTGVVTVYDGNHWQSMHETALHQKKSVSQIAFQPEGTLAASAGDDNTVKLWDVKTGEVRATLEHEVAARSLAFDPQDSDFLTSLSADGTVRMWDLAELNSPEVSRQFGGNSQEYANSIAIQPTGKSLVAASQDGKLRYWKTR